MRRRFLRRFVREEGGFTLVEVLVTMMLMLVVMFALYSIFDMSLRVFGFGNDKTEATENARLGLEKMEREIRAAYPQDKVADPNTPLLTSWTSTRIEFGNDLDGNRKIECVSGGSPPCETISYDIYQPAGGSTYTLGRINTYGGGRQPVVEFVKVNGLTFEYLDRYGATVPSGAANEKNIHIVRISLTTEVDRSLADATTQTLSTDVALRNRTN